MARAPGPKNPGKYPAPVGQNYNRYGEQPGYIYNPYTDKYLPDPKVQGEYLQSQGLGEPKPPGLGETILPIAATAGALYGAQAAAPQLVGSWGKGEGLLGGIKNTLGFGGEAAASSAPNVLSPGIAEGLASSANDVAAWNAAATGDAAALDSLALQSGASSGATGATSAAEGLSGAGAPPGLGMQALGYGGAALGAYNAFEGIKGKDPIQAGLGGAGVWAGLNMAGVGGLAGLTNPVGWGLIAAPTLLALANKMGDKDRWKEEGDRLNKLKEKGVYIPDGLINSLPTKGRSKQELIALAEQTGDPAAIKFAQSRDVNDLKGAGQNIVGYSTFAEHDPEWFNRPLDQRIAYANQLLDAELVDEARGQIKVDWKKAPPPPWAAPAAPAPNQTQLETNKPLPGGPRKPVRKGRKD